MYAPAHAKKGYDWVLILPSRSQNAKPKQLLLAKDHALLWASALSKPKLTPVTLAHVLLSVQQQEYASVHGVLASYSFDHLANALDRYARVSLWSESLVICQAGGQDKRFFNLYYHLIHWLNQPSMPAYYLDNLFFYYFLQLNGVLAANSQRHCPQPISFAQLVNLSEDQLQHYLLNWHQQSQYHQALYQHFIHFMPRPPRSLSSLTQYDALT